MRIILPVLRTLARLLRETHPLPPHILTTSTPRGTGNAGFALFGKPVRPETACYLVPFCRTGGLALRFFGFRLAMATLGLGHRLPAAGQLWGFHPLECALTGRIQEAKTPVAAGVFASSGNLWLPR